MQLSSRYKAILEVLEEVFKDKKPADGIIYEYMRERRYIGAKDRRFIMDTVWDIIRNRRKLVFDAGSGKARDVLICYLKDENLDEIFDGSKYGLEKLSDEEKNQKPNKEIYPTDVELETPRWIYDLVKNDALLRSLNSTAPADFRVNVKSRGLIVEEMAVEGFDVVLTPHSPIGIRSMERINLNNCMAYQSGKIDVQDEGSQLAAILCDVKPDMKIVDYCAGAGGKSLTLAFLLGGKGKIEAHDVDWHRLEQIKPRAERLGMNNVEIKREIVDVDYDRFIIDAPCSGTGTWRRSPDAKFRLTPERLKELNKMQYEILEKGYVHTKSGGRIVYITCSILKQENEDIVTRFLNEYKDVKLLRQERFSPLETNTDGFFAAVMEKK